MPYVERDSLFQLGIILQVIGSLNCMMVTFYLCVSSGLEFIKFDDLSKGINFFLN